MQRVPQVTLRLASRFERWIGRDWSRLVLLDCIWTTGDAQGGLLFLQLLIRIGMTKLLLFNTVGIRAPVANNWPRLAQHFRVTATQTLLAKV